MPQIGCLLLAIFIIILGFSMMPKTMAFIMAISFIGGLADGYRKFKKKEQKRKEMEEMGRKERREKWRRIANGKSLNDDFDHV